MGEFFLEPILNYIGGTVRWIYGTIWRTILNRPKFKFSEYIDGPEKPIDSFDNFHGCVNHMVGIIVIGLIFLVVILTKYS